jgi:hypothetical protein
MPLALQALVAFELIARRLMMLAHGINMAIAQSHATFDPRALAVP